MTWTLKKNAVKISWVGLGMLIGNFELNSLKETDQGVDQALTDP